jgi:DHA1 family tetracycline resistance protein-like MFS transporter
MQTEKRHWYGWIEFWYLVYAFMGLVVAGLVPILIPLIVSKSGNAGLVGVVVAALSLGGLTSPLWGALADRRRLHRALLAGGMLLAGVSLAAFAVSTRPILWVLLAVLQGLGIAAAATVANLFVVEAHPKTEWDQRIGWLQTFYGIGQVSGLLLAGLFTRADLRLGMWLAAGVSLIAAILAWFSTRTPPVQPGPKPVLRHPARHAESVVNSPQRLFHHPQWNGLGELLVSLRSPYGLFLLVWLLAFAGPAALFSQYPLLMQKLYGVVPETSSVAFAIIAALGLTLYTPAGDWSKHDGPARILAVSLGFRLFAFAVLLWLALLRSSGTIGLLALIAFAFVVWAWSLMSVSGTDLAARLSPSGEGQGLGIFNAMTSVAGILGALIGGWVASAWGYIAIVVFAVLGVLLGLILSSFINRKHAGEADQPHD